MLNYLIFLGLVPGTSFQITFSELLVALDVALVLYLLRRRHIIHEFKYYWHELKFYQLYWQVYLNTKRGGQLRLPL